MRTLNRAKALAAEQFYLIVGVFGKIFFTAFAKNLLTFLSQSGEKQTSRGRLAQLVEHRPYKPAVAGSSPAPPTK